VQVLRIDLRQERDFAAAWVTLGERLPGASGDIQQVDHLLLKRRGADWRIANLYAGPPRDSSGS
jgi:hypothetical protein